MRSQVATDSSTPALDARFVRALFHDLYGRAPLAAERAAWVGEPLPALVQSALKDEAAWRHWFDEQLYYFMLIDRFEPRDESLDALPRKLAEGRLAPRDALHQIALNTSFALRNPGADTFVTVVMEQFCGIEVQRSTRELEIGKKAYDGGSGMFLGARASSQADVVNIAVTHPDAAKHLVAREYERLCRVPCPRRDRAKWGKKVQKNPRSLLGLYADWFESEAYAARVAAGAPLSNRSWVRSVHIDLGDRIPLDEDVEALRGALDALGDPQPLRSLIVRMLLDADGTKAPRGPEIPDHEAWVRQTFERLLGRAPSAEERSTFLGICRDESEGPELVLYVLLTSPEYQLA